MDYINIISQEAITTVPTWVCFAILGICVGILIVYGIWVYKDIHNRAKYIILIGFGIIIFELIAIIISNIFLAVPTDRYRYTATIDKENITVSQYEEFIEKYNPDIKDGIYYWEE